MSTYAFTATIDEVRRIKHVLGGDTMVILKLALMASVFYGAVRTANLAWGLGDIGVGLMAWLNIIAILILFLMGKPALKALKDYEAQRKAGVKEYSFDPDALGIKNADFWSK